MKNLTLFSLALFLILQPNQGFARNDAFGSEKIELLRITSEFYPDQTYTLGIEVDPSLRAFKAVYYLDPYPDAKVPYKRFPVSTLARPQVLIRAKDQYDVVKISLVNQTLTVMYRKDVREDRWTSKAFEIQCNSSLSGCNVMDSATHRFITTAHITAHEALILGVFEKAVGIENILTR
ncbi:MAG: hypothetical protein KGP28_08605 [Bdellovibrionales bacterium]|nr:hypothetical protein [Bdellovibrionales bacterium]